MNAKCEANCKCSNVTCVMLHHAIRHVITRAVNRVINNVCSAVQWQIHSFSVHIQIMFILHSVVFSSIVAESKRLKVRVYVCG